MPTTAAREDRVLTIPNALSVLRLLGVPLFLWLLLGPQEDGWAIVVLAVGGFTDWLDGKLARLLDQYSRFGALLDPAVDRLYILAALVALGLRDVVPWWAVVALVARDLVLAVCLVVLRSRGYGPFVVTYLGKAATFLLLYAFPLLLLGSGDTAVAAVAWPLGAAFGAWGVALYLYAPPVIPEELRYTSEHEWVRELGDGLVRVGITDHAQNQLGDIVFVQLPDVGTGVEAGDAIGEVESTKSVSELFSPVSGTVVEVNDEAVANPEIVNSDPYGAGWLVKVDITATGPVLTAEEYAAQVAS